MQIHRDLLRCYGGERGGPRRGSLEAIGAAVEAAAGEGVVAAAATFADAVVRHQPFVDANHRVASRGAGLILRLNGHTFKPNGREAFCELLWRAPADASADLAALRRCLEQVVGPLPKEGVG